MVCNDNSCLPPGEKEVKFTFKNQTRQLITKKQQVQQQKKNTDLPAKDESITKQDTRNNTTNSVSIAGKDTPEISNNSTKTSTEKQPLKKVYGHYFSSAF